MRKISAVGVSFPLVWPAGLQSLRAIFFLRGGVPFYTHLVIGFLDRVAARRRRLSGNDCLFLVAIPEKETYHDASNRANPG